MKNISRLTLTVEKEIIEKAKKYAMANGKSLSSIIENYLKIITSESKPSNYKITPLVRSM